MAAIHGTALGGGLEVALCAHYRVGLASSKYGLPEVNIGLCSGAGGTAVASIDRRAQGPRGNDLRRHLPASEAAADGLIDEVVDGDWEALRAAAISFAERAVAESLPLVKVRDRDDQVTDVDPQIFADFRAKIARKTCGFLAPEYNIRCIEAATSLPFDEGIKVEATLFMELMTGLSPLRSATPSSPNARRTRSPTSPRTRPRSTSKKPVCSAPAPWAAALR